ncbi:acyl-CoA dehydrogenase [Clostridium fermenticellae]|uniref:Acyl-CoA dehydrogenase family protein n=2 Tax=Clostridium TaxID=1485 RepID=A0ABS8N8T4_9CLOT|nr:MULTISPECIES: acyl-CoA dehydrogenase family protein [Clostridium]AYD40499.1 acyl-CoA dehydrogenase [Clostridium fermenticellae]MCC9296056.1 acyl-CoA dehydrogenase family protein [Clostridium aromativorans]
MNFELTAQQKQVVDTVKKLTEDYLLPGVLERDENSEYPIEAYRELGRTGLIGLPYAEEYGGSGAGYMEYVLAIEEISKVDASMGISYSVCTSLYGGCINNFGSEMQKKKYLPLVFSGKSLGSFGLTEPNAGSDASGVITKAKRENDYYILNGSKCFTTNGPLADYCIVFASTNPEAKTKGLSAFIVEMNTPGIRIGRIENKMGIRSAKVSEVFFENVKIPKENLIGEEGKGFKIAMNALDGGRMGVAAQGIGIAEGAFEIARKYLMEREQFGKPLYKNQYLGFKMAELKIKIEQAKLLLYKAAYEKDNGRSYTVPAAMAKYACTNTAMEVTTEAVQMLGGNGYMKGYNVERMMRDAKITQIYEGTNEIQQLVVSGSIFK